MNALSGVDECSLDQRVDSCTVLGWGVGYAHIQLSVNAWAC